MIVLAEVAPCWVFIHFIVFWLDRESGRGFGFWERVKASAFLKVPGQQEPEEASPQS